MVIHDPILTATRTLRSSDRISISNWWANIWILKILSSGLLLRQEETPIPPKLKIKSAKYRKIDIYIYSIYEHIQPLNFMLSSWLTVDWLTPQLILATEV